MLLTNRRLFFLRLLNASRSSKSPTRRNRLESQSRRPSLPYGASVEVLESRLLLSATAAYQPLIEVAGRVAAPVPGNQVIRPAVTLATAPYTPAQMTQAYGVNQISFGGVTGTGAGQTIAIVDAFNDPNIISDAAGFNSNFNLPQFNVAGGPTFTVLNQTGGTSLPTIDGQGWDLEESLDVEWAHSIAPQANIILYESNTNNDPDMDQAVATAAANPAVSVVSMSWGESEFAGETSEDPFVLTPTGRTGGVTFLAGSGDWDSPAIYPSLSPDVVSVGGTSLDIQPDGTYVSESVWNNNNGYGTGGGVSQYESLPAYQDGLNGINGASTTNRNAPDVSMDADPDTGVYVLDTYSGGWYQVGGTSLSTPLWAGLVSIANQGRALNGEPSLNGLTQTLPTLYNLPSTDFNDITTGGNGTYNAAPGYDLVSGIGTPIANLLVPDLANSTINWSPTASGPASATTNENTSLTFSGNDAISVTDQIAGTNADTLTLSVNDGSLALGSTNGLTFTSGANDASAMTVTGSIGDIESAVSGLVYTPNSGYTGSDSLSVGLADPLANVRRCDERPDHGQWAAVAHRAGVGHAQRGRVARLFDGQRQCDLRHRHGRRQQCRFTDAPGRAREPDAAVDVGIDLHRSQRHFILHHQRDGRQSRSGPQRSDLSADVRIHRIRRAGRLGRRSGRQPVGVHQYSLDDQRATPRDHGARDGVAG